MPCDTCCMNGETKTLVLAEITKLETAIPVLTEMLNPIKTLINKMQACALPSAKGGKNRKPTARNMYIGHCMRKPENDGLGKPMATCSELWKSMNDEAKSKWKVD